MHEIARLVAYHYDILRDLEIKFGGAVCLHPPLDQKSFKKF